jgi:hypothetical protein
LIPGTSTLIGEGISTSKQENIAMFIKSFEAVEEVFFKKSDVSTWLLEQLLVAVSISVKKLRKGFNAYPVSYQNCWYQQKKISMPSGLSIIIKVLTKGKK